jgi:hypothetical protein
MKKWIVTIALAGLSALAWGLPTLQDVEAEVNQGRYARAEEMMREVVAAKPDSAKAHYIYAEILAHGAPGSLPRRRRRRGRSTPTSSHRPGEVPRVEAALLHTGPGGASPDAARRSRRRTSRPAAGVPSWVWLAGLVVVGVLLWRGFARSRAAQGGSVAAAPGAAYGAPTGGYAPGANAPMGTTPYGPGYPGYPPPRGSGMLGTGLAAAGGVAAGMLAGEMLHRNRDANTDLLPAVSRDSSTRPRRRSARSREPADRLRQRRRLVRVERWWRRRRRGGWD